MANLGTVRHGAMDSVDCFEAPATGLHERDEVIVRTERGLEWGELVSRLQHFEDAEAGGRELKGEIVRKASEQDVQKQEQISSTLEREEFQFCQSLIQEYKLPMKLVSVEHLFDGSRLVFFFISEGRVDFRALVKELAKRYRTRIEMRQIGVRDEARLLGRFAPCGRELCCRSFLKVLKPIPMKVAKSQKSTLDPAKISGRCGRLKCCLNFEEDLYNELKQNLPRRGVAVSTPLGQGVVVGHEVFEQKVTVRLTDGAEHKVALSETAPPSDAETDVKDTQQRQPHAPGRRSPRGRRRK